MDVRLVVEKGSKQKREIRLKSEDTVIGRRTGCDLRVPSAAVSRRHCRLSFRDDCLMVEDLQSANGTYVNGIRVNETQVVQPGDRLEVGPVTFLVKYKGGSDADVPELEIEEVIPEFDIDEIEVAEAEEAKPKKKRKKTVAEPKTTKKKAATETTPKKAPKKAPEKPEPPAQEAEEEEELPPILDESSWQMPHGEDIRDILSQMDDSRNPS
jgi:pSer/pThr/pTyr-binding forkhead associated (FHA) protein